MTDFLRDPIWQSIGVIVAVLLVLVPLIWRIRSQRRSLLYKISTTSVWDDKVLISKGIWLEYEDRRKFEFSFENNKVSKIDLVDIEVKNIGSKPILLQDQPLLVTYGQNAKVLKAQITNTSPSGLVIKSTWQNGILTLNVARLNRGEKFGFSALVQELDVVRVDIPIETVEIKTIVGEQERTVSFWKYYLVGLLIEFGILISFSEQNSWLQSIATNGATPWGIIWRAIAISYLIIASAITLRWYFHIKFA
jgi:hypothetical protein